MTLFVTSNKQNLRQDTSDLYQQHLAVSLPRPVRPDSATPLDIPQPLS